MVSRFEAEIPDSRVDEFRAFVASVDGKIAKDGKIIKDSKSSTKERHAQIIDKLLEPINSNVEQEVMQGYKAMLQRAFKRNLADEIDEINIETLQDCERAGKILHKEFSSINKHSQKIGGLAYLVGRYGLVNGQPKSREVAAQDAGYSQSPGYVKNVEAVALLGVYHVFSHNKHSEVMTTKRDW